MGSQDQFVTVVTMVMTMKKMMMMAKLDCADVMMMMTYIYEGHPQVDLLSDDDVKQLMMWKSKG